MEQKSNVQNRAEKTYKNSREKFGLLIREAVSNAIHSTLIRLEKVKNNSYLPRVEVIIEYDDTSLKIVVVDNGEGFNTKNRRYFTHLDERNAEKEELKLHPQGQGRLALVYFCDSAIYDSVFEGSNGQRLKNTFIYPEVGPSLFDIENSEGSIVQSEDMRTTLTMELSKQQTFSRSVTFFNKYSDIEKLKNWFLENFFPFFIDAEKLTLKINFNGIPVELSKSFIEKDVVHVDFSANLGELRSVDYEFRLWLVKNEFSPRRRNLIRCFARQLCAEIEDQKLEYEIDLPEAYDWFLTSSYFDEHVDQKGDRIVIETTDVHIIQFKMNKALDEHFRVAIEQNRKNTKTNVDQVKKRYQSISPFLDDSSHENRNIIVSESDLVSSAIEAKGKAEKEYWTSDDIEGDEVDKLVNSSLHIYVRHRDRILKRLQLLIKKFDDEGIDKKELEDNIHDIFLRRGETLKTHENVNHLHNLWILDDKYTIFSKTFNAKSTQRGHAASDVYMWIDDPQQVKELLILELKSTTHAHNAGDRHESMVAQVKRYASQFYKNPVKILNWDIDPSNIRYSGFILARKSDIHKELTSNNVSGNAIKIPFLKSSYFFNEQFNIGMNRSTEPEFFSIRIEMFSFEDIYDLAISRNNVFFKLLSGELRSIDKTIQSY